MPFTFAHPVITMPWWKRKSWPVSALIIGCMAPDFEYFLRFRASAIWSHEGLGILLFNLPLVVLLYILFELLIRPVLYVYLPSWFPYRWSRHGKLPATPIGWLTVLLLGMTGVVTHLLWDQFTHKGAWVVNQIPFLSQVIHIGFIQIPIYKICQHGSSLIGLVLIAWWIHRHLFVPYQTRQHSSYSSFPFWCLMAAVYVVIMLIAWGSMVEEEGLAYMLQLVVPAISSFLLALLITCLVFWRAARSKQLIS